MNIINNTLYDKDLILRYNKFYAGSYMVKNFIIITVISIAFIIYMLIQQEWAYAGILVGILALYYLLTLGMQKLTTNRMLKRSPLVDNPMTQTYVFQEENFSVTNVKSYTVDYKDIQSVKRAKDFYMIQTSDRKTYIVDFKGFEKEEDIFTLGNFFNQKLNLKMKLQ
jgi:hypothetical protein